MEFMGFFFLFAFLGGQSDLGYNLLTKDEIRRGNISAEDILEEKDKKGSDSGSCTYCLTLVKTVT